MHLYYVRTPKVTACNKTILYEILQAVSELPRPNKDTLAYMMIHLQTVAANYKINKVSNTITNTTLFNA